MENEDDIIGYTVAYDRDEIYFPVYVVTTIAVALLGAAIIKSMPILALLAVAPAAVAYYNLPLIEIGRPRLGAGQYGLFVEGLGLLSWRGIKEFELVETESRGTTGHELHIVLRQPIGEVLLVDWRRRPPLRRLMRLPWSMKGNTFIRVPLDIMDRPATEIFETFVRVWRYHRGK